MCFNFSSLTQSSPPFCLIFHVGQKFQDIGVVQGIFLTLKKVLSYYMSNKNCRQSVCYMHRNLNGDVSSVKVSGRVLSRGCRKFWQKKKQKVSKRKKSVGVKYRKVGRKRNRVVPKGCKLVMDIKYVTILLYGTVLPSVHLFKCIWGLDQQLYPTVLPRALIVSTIYISESTYSSKITSSLFMALCLCAHEFQMVFSLPRVSQTQPSRCLWDSCTWPFQSHTQFNVAKTSLLPFPNLFLILELDHRCCHPISNLEHRSRH